MDLDDSGWHGESIADLPGQIITHVSFFFPVLKCNSYLRQTWWDRDWVQMHHKQFYLGSLSDCIFANRSSKLQAWINLPIYNCVASIGCVCLKDHNLTRLFLLFVTWLVSIYLEAVFYIPLSGRYWFIRWPYHFKVIVEIHVLFHPCVPDWKYARIVILVEKALRLNDTVTGSLLTRFLPLLPFQNGMPTTPIRRNLGPVSCVHCSTRDKAGRFRSVWLGCVGNSFLVG